MSWNWQAIFTYFPELLKASLMTLELVAFSSLLGLIFGVILGLLRLSKNPLIKALPMAYIFFFRGSADRCFTTQDHHLLGLHLSQAGLGFGIEAVHAIQQEGCVQDALQPTTGQAVGKEVVTPNEDRIHRLGAGHRRISPLLGAVRAILHTQFT